MSYESKIISEFYNKRVLIYGDSIETLDWSSKYAQLIRFKILTEIGDLKGKSILDIGCGLADLYVFIQSKDIEVEYTGIDLSSEIIKICKKKYPELKFLCTDILKDFTIEKADFVLSSGIHSIGSFSRTKKLIKRMYDLCNIAMGTNMFSSYYNKKNLAKYVKVYKPEKIFKFCKKLSDYVVLRHDYLPKDFTIYIYKQRFDSYLENNI